ncbi:hypothetical protein [Flavobacterium sp.]|uniref:hypothetical protein n=1 Tax=Flavobacterium sp. TaxID=239 RepID=UPI0031DDCFB0
MKFKFYLTFTILTILQLTLSNCASDDNQGDTTVQPKPDPAVEPKPDTEHTLDLSYKKVINGKEITQLIKTNDNGFIGIVFSEDYEVIKFDSEFNIVWDKTYGGSKNDYAQSILQDKDGNFFVIGHSESSDGDVTNNFGNFDIWLCKIDGSGNLLWQKNYGGSGYEGINKDHAMIQTSEGGFMFVGYSSSKDHDITNNQGGMDAWLVKISAIGVIENQKNIGGSIDDYGIKLIKVKNNYVMSVGAQSTDKDFTGKGQWIFGFSEIGNFIWKKQLNDLNGGTLGSTESGDVLVANSNFTNLSLYKLDINTGNIKQQKSITLNDPKKKQPSANRIIESKDNGIIVIGDLGYGNDEDAMLFRVDSNFNSVVSKFTIGNDYDKSASIIPVGNDTYVYQIITQSTDLELKNDQSIASMILSLKEN